VEAAGARLHHIDEGVCGRTMPPRRREIDDLDRRLAARLRSDGRESTRSLARTLGVSETTVAARLRSLERDGAMRVVAVTDVEAFGYGYLAFVAVTIRGRRPQAVADEIASIPATISVAVVTGRHQVIVTVLARTPTELGRIVGHDLAIVDGVARVICSTAVDVARFEFTWGVLRPSDEPELPAPPVVGLDGSDAAILASLQRDARKPNRRIAEELGVTEGTVRGRLGRMQAEGQIRITAISDIDAFGPVAAAFVGVRVAGGDVAAVQEALLSVDEITVIARTLGEWDFVLVMASVAREALLDAALATIAGIPSVATVEVMEVVAAAKHVFTWVRIR
jgi:DNA-binding Lrp family transcriptional regulator